MPPRSQIVKSLRIARELIADEERWSKGFMALDRRGRPCHPDSPGAVKWCIVAALNRGEFALDAIRSLKKHLPPGTLLGTFQDNAEHAQVLALLDLTIADLEESTP